MRARMGALAASTVLLAAALVGCSDDTDPVSAQAPSDGPPSEVTVDCPEFEDTARKIVDAQASLYTAAGDPEAIDDLVAELDALKEGAPEDVRTALDDMGTAFRDAAELLEEPTAQSRAELVALAPGLSDAGRTITEYVQEQCG